MHTFDCKHKSVGWVGKMQLDLILGYKKKTHFSVFRSYWEKKISSFQSTLILMCFYKMGRKINIALSDAKLMSFLYTTWPPRIKDKAFFV